MKTGLFGDTYYPEINGAADEAARKDARFLPGFRAAENLHANLFLFYRNR